MPKMNFTKSEQEIYNLALDLARCDYECHVDMDKVSKTDLENRLRDKINKDILGGLNFRRAIRRNNILLNEIVEEIVDTAIAENVVDSAFMDAFVEIKNRGLGDTTAFYSEGGLVSVTTFAGNHWDTKRERIDLGEEIVLPKEWMYIHVYEDLERFLLGITSLDKLMDKIYKSVNKFIQDRIYAQFANVKNAVPAEFYATGNSEDAVGAMCDKVQAAGGYSSLIVAGTKGALRKLAAVVPDKMFANSQKEAKANTGSIGEWEANKLMVIPQTLKSGTFTTALDDDTIFILGGDTKPIKLEIYGDSRTDINTDGKKYNDQSVDVQIQTKFGIGLVMSNYFGVFKFA